MMSRIIGATLAQKIRGGNNHLPASRFKNSLIELEINTVDYELVNAFNKLCILKTLSAILQKLGLCYHASTDESCYCLNMPEDETDVALTQLFYSKMGGNL